MVCHKIVSMLYTLQKRWVTPSPTKPGPNKPFQKINYAEKNKPIPLTLPAPADEVKRQDCNLASNRDSTRRAQPSRRSLYPLGSARRIPRTA